MRWKMSCNSEQQLLHEKFSTRPIVALLQNVEKCLFAIEQQVNFTSSPLLPASKKDVLPASLFSKVVYNFFVPL